MCLYVFEHRKLASLVGGPKKSQKLWDNQKKNGKEIQWPLNSKSVISGKYTLLQREEPVSPHLLILHFSLIPYSQRFQNPQTGSFIKTKSIVHHKKVNSPLDCDICKCKSITILWAILKTKF